MCINCKLFGDEVKPITKAQKYIYDLLTSRIKDDKPLTIFLPRHTGKTHWEKIYKHFRESL